MRKLKPSGHIIVSTYQRMTSAYAVERLGSSTSSAAYCDPDVAPDTDIRCCRTPHISSHV